MLKIYNADFFQAIVGRFTDNEIESLIHALEVELKERNEYKNIESKM